MKHIKSEYYRKHKKRILKRLKNKYEEDEAFRDKVKTYNRERYHTDAEYRRKTLERAKTRNRRLKSESSD